MVPAKIVAIAAARLGVDEAEVLSRHRRFPREAATAFWSGGRGGLQFIVGDDGSVLSVPTFRDLDWGMDLFRQGIRDAKSSLWHAPDQARSVVDDRSGSAPDQTGSGGAWSPVTRSPSRPGCSPPGRVRTR